MNSLKTIRSGPNRVTLYFWQYNNTTRLQISTFHRDDELPKAIKLTMREKRFIKFASVEYDGQLYMTPQDFLDSVVDSEPRPRHKRRILSDQELEVMRNATPSLKHGNSHMFRNLKDKEPQTGFRIAFNMFDTDRNERVDKDEFLVRNLSNNCV
ncbi:hypothetical protein PV325_009286 [Microctonus aethiopoides]|nr:hypothetical protein PV325_009286 [Microctonus aethiopoides]